MTSDPTKTTERPASMCGNCTYWMAATATDGDCHIFEFPVPATAGTECGDYELRTDANAAMMEAATNG